MDDHVQQRLDAMDQQALIGEKGYQIFSRMYALTNPRPEHKPFVGRNFYTRIGLAIVMVASSIVSASHTIPTFANAKGKEIYEINFVIVLVGIAAFFMSELALAIFAYVGVMGHYRETGQEPKSLKRLLRLGVIVPLVVMAAANVNHEFQINGTILPDWISKLIILAISLAAPFMGYISGEVFATFEVTDRVDALKHESDQREENAEWESRCRQAWGRSKGDYGGRIKVEAMPTPQLSALSSGQDRTGQDKGHATGTGYTKQSEARNAVKEHLRMNPDDMSLTVRALADKIGQSKTTVGDVMKEVRLEMTQNAE